MRCIPDWTFIYSEKRKHTRAMEQVGQLIIQLEGKIPNITIVYSQVTTK